MLDCVTSEGTSFESRKTAERRRDHKQSPASRGRASESLGAGSVLLIEDDEDVADAIANVLERENYTVYRSCDALDGLEQLQSGLAPDIILLDLMMPRMNGWEFRIAQRREPILASIPIIVMSADDS